MLKLDEKYKQDSCWNKAHIFERLFILLERDKAAPTTIRFWAKERIRLGLNTANDAQICEAYDCATRMKRWKRSV